MGPRSTAGPHVKFEAVRTRRQFGQFCDFTAQLHPRDLFVPPLRETVASWWRGDVPGVRLFVLRDDAGNVVARTTLHTDAALDDKLGSRLQLFGLTEFVHNPDVTRELFASISSAARAAGRTATFGPVALLPNQSGGVVTSGHEERGFIDSPWTPAYYPAAYEANGLRRRFEADTWICSDLQNNDLDPDAVFPTDGARLSSEDLVMHRGSPRHLERQLPLLRTMLNASFAQLGYFTQIDVAQLRRQTDGLAWLLDPALLLYLTRAGTPVAFILAVPDISAFVSAVDGRLGPLQRLRLLATRRRYRREAVLVIKGTVPDAQGRGYMRLLSRELLHNLRAGGYTTLRSTFVERDNPGSAAQYVAMGGRPLHGLTFYEGPA